MNIPETVMIYEKKNKSRKTQELKVPAVQSAYRRLLEIKAVGNTRQRSRAEPGNSGEQVRKGALLSSALLFLLGLGSRQQNLFSLWILQPAR